MVTGPMRAPDLIGVVEDLRAGLGVPQANSEIVGVRSARLRLETQALDPRALLIRRNELLTRYLRRLTDERAVRCGHVRLLVVQQGRGIEGTRAWLGAVRLVLRDDVGATDPGGRRP